MKFRPIAGPCCAAKHRAGFTLAEVLAALVFMAIVIPTAVQGLRVANLAGVVGQRRAVAARVGDKVLNEALVTGQWQTAAQNGVTQEGAVPYSWSVRTDPWTPLNTLRQLTVTVSFPVQGGEYQVHLSTVVDPNASVQMQQ